MTALRVLKITPPQEGACSELPHKGTFTSWPWAVRGGLAQGPAGREDGVLLGLWGYRQKGRLGEVGWGLQKLKAKKETLDSARDYPTPSSWAPVLHWPKLHPPPMINPGGGSEVA